MVLSHYTYVYIRNTYIYIYVPMASLVGPLDAPSQTFRTPGDPGEYATIVLDAWIIHDAYIETKWRIKATLGRGCWGTTTCRLQNRKRARERIYALAPATHTPGLNGFTIYSPSSIRSTLRYWGYWIQLWCIIFILTNVTIFIYWHF